MRRENSIVKCGLVYDSFFEKHRTGTGHPEQPVRASRVYREIAKAGLIPRILETKPKACEEETLALAHKPAYLAQAKKDVLSGRSTLSTGDTQICGDSWEVARRATGGSASCGRRHEWKDHKGFCLSRPPAIMQPRAKEWAFVYSIMLRLPQGMPKKLGAGKILIVDWDAHHGNGTQDAFYEDDSVMFLSTHQSPWYPGTGSREETGKGKGLGYTLNFPRPAGSGRSEIVEGAFGLDLPKKLSGFGPELILVSAGFDSRRGDPLGQFRLQDEDFANLTKLIVGLANEYCEGKVISVLEGGYDLDGSKASLAHFTSLLEEESI